MKLYLKIVFVIVFLHSCNRKNEKSTVKIEAKNYSFVQEDINNTKILDSFPNYKISKEKIFSFKFNLNKENDFLKNIKIYKLNKYSVKLWQTINVYQNIDNEGIKLIDWNFDGYKDISVKLNCGSGGCSFLIWNYEPKKNKFKLNKELSEFLGLEIDSTNKFIIFHYRSGFSEESWDTLKYENDKLVKLN